VSAVFSLYFGTVGGHRLAVHVTVISACIIRTVGGHISKPQRIVKRHRILFIA
jgi:hypothetical protein